MVWRVTCLRGRRCRSSNQSRLVDTVGVPFARRAWLVKRFSSLMPFQIRPPVVIWGGFCYSGIITPISRMSVLTRKEGTDPYSSPYTTHYSSFRFLFHSFIPSEPKASNELVQGSAVCQHGLLAALQGAGRRFVREQEWRVMLSPNG